MAGYPAEDGLLSSLPTNAHVIVMSASSVELGDDNAMAAYHLRTERAVHDSAHPWTILRPCSLQSNVLRWHDQLSRGRFVAAPFGDVPTAMVDPADVPAVAVAAITDTAHGRRAYRLSGPEALAPPQQVAVVAAELGRPLVFEGLADREVFDLMPEHYAKAEASRSHAARLRSRLLPRPKATLLIDAKRRSVSERSADDCADDQWAGRLNQGERPG